ncbi:MAG: type I-E CRISPR-associated protein Cas5/CasD [Bacteroidota bacterium]
MPGFFLHLAGPMQSWADTGFGQLRGTGLFPSRAGVLGIVAAAHGIPRNDPALVALHSAFRVHVATAQPGHVLRDFHTVETVEGKAPTLTQREYHHDAHFVALVESDDAEAVERAADALRRPVYPPFLGRRSCPPALPLLPLEGNASLVGLAQAALGARGEFPVLGERRSQRMGLRKAAVPLYLDGHFDTAPAPFSAAPVSYGTRRDRLSAPRRAYVDRPYTRVLVSSSDVPE